MRTRTVTNGSELEIFPRSKEFFQPFRSFHPSILEQFIPMSRRPARSDQATHSVHPHGVVFAATRTVRIRSRQPDPANSFRLSSGRSQSWKWTGSPGPTAGFARASQSKVIGAARPHIRVHVADVWLADYGGVWLYHDHSICDETTSRSARSGSSWSTTQRPSIPARFIVTNADFPGGSPTGSPRLTPPATTELHQCGKLSTTVVSLPEAAAC